MRIVSGIQPTGTPHLGNYFGAFENWIKAQNDGHECLFFIADQHSLTIQQDQKQLSRNILETAAIFLAIGLDKSTIFVQSDVPAHTQLAWVLSCLAPMGQMERMIQFKEKSEQHVANLGLFSYPVLMAADILLYKTDLVPVGIDQVQHLELTRTIANKFNNQYKELFTEPKTLHTTTTKVVGLDGGAKMSKSKNNHISLIEDEDALRQKLSTAATDPARVGRKDPGNPLICNIYSLHQLFSGNEDQEWVKKGCSTAEIGCLDCKGKLFENMNAFLKPIREKFNELMKRPDEIRNVLREGAEKANRIANETLKEVYDTIGLRY